jgi:hypothetical protein
LLGLEPAFDQRELVEDHEDHRELPQEGCAEVEIHHCRIEQLGSWDLNRVGCFAELVPGQLKGCEDDLDHFADYWESLDVLEDQVGAIFGLLVKLSVAVGHACLVVEDLEDRCVGGEA